jgi:hypothetical protein
MGGLMAKKKKDVLRHIAMPGLLGSLLLCQEQVHAQSADAVQLAPNEQVMQTWSQGNPGAAAPALTRDEKGNTRLEWKASLTSDVYTNDIESAAGQLTSPLRTGTFFKNSFNSDLRSIGKDNTVDYFQLGMTNSNDLAVLSQNRYQVNNLQFGRTGEGYSLAFGDIAPNFSSLSSSLGARGLYGQRQFGEITASGFTGLVAESWEALDGHVPRSQYLKDVHGLKIEKAFGSSLRTYVTGQGFSEREPTAATSQPLLTPRGRSRSMSGGFQYQQDQFTLNGETANSQFEDGGASNRSGGASILDATWRGESLGLRGGYHDISSGFTSLSLGAQAGIREAYVGADWTAASWVTLSTDLRRSKNEVLASVFSPETHTDTDSASARANFTFGPEHPGWAFALQQAASRSLTSAGQSSRNRDFSSSLNYSTPAWNAGLVYGLGKVTSEASPTSDSLNDNWSINLSRIFSDAQADQPQTWNVNVTFSATAQKQRLVAGGQTGNTSYSLGLSGQRSGWGTFNFMLTGGETVQPLGGPNLRLIGFQLDAFYPFKDQNGIKFYLRNTRRNIDDPLLSASEKVAGLQLVYSF